MNEFEKHNKRFATRMLAKCKRNNTKAIVSISVKEVDGVIEFDIQSCLPDTKDLYEMLQEIIKYKE